MATEDNLETNSNDQTKRKRDQCDDIDEGSNKKQKKWESCGDTKSDFYKFLENDLKTRSKWHSDFECDIMKFKIELLRNGYVDIKGDDLDYLLVGTVGILPHIANRFIKEGFSVKYNETSNWKTTYIKIKL